jgi:LEA14-like dessication related protein
VTAVRAILLATGILASVPNCTDLYSVATHGLTAPVLTSPTATAASEPGGVRVTIALTAQNPNDIPIALDSVDYQVAISGTQVFSGSQEGLTVDEQTTETVHLSGVVDVSQPIFKTFHGGQTVPFTVTGVAHVDSPAGVPIDFAFATNNSFVVPDSLPPAP